MNDHDHALTESKAIRALLREAENRSALAPADRAGFALLSLQKMLRVLPASQIECAIKNTGALAAAEQQIAQHFDPSEMTADHWTLALVSSASNWTFLVSAVAAGRVRIVEIDPNPQN